LLSSGASITYAHHALLSGNRAGTLYANIITLILAIVFTGFQYIEYIDCNFTISDSVFGSSFFCSTGLHGIHVALGTIFIYVAFLRIFNYHLTTKHHVGYEFSIYYWHFVDIV
jgi:cytochrome c oxidase subunit 3